MDSFDYIVVGAGTAGCVVAARLSENAGRRVLLLEAGGSDLRFWVRVPIGYGRTFNDPRVNWMYESEPEPALCGRRGFWPRGKVLGGSGSINDMIYIRGFPWDFDGWQARGNSGWGWKEVLPYFRKIEDYPGGEEEYRARGGPIHVTDMAAGAHPLCFTFIETCRRLGYPVLKDFNAAPVEGVGIYQITTRGGMRMSTARGYLRPALRRANLRLLLRAHALRLLFDGPRAVGVAYQHRGRTQQARASRSVIVCLGSVNSPQLLQLSGIGDSDLLRRHGIAVVAHHPRVGRNLQDHLDVSYVYRSRVPTLNDEFHPLSGKLKAGMRYLLTRTGPLAMSINQSGGFLKSNPGQPHPNLQIVCSPVSYDPLTWPLRRLLKPHPFSGFVISFQSCRPTSRGRIEIRSAKPLDPPLIFPNYLSTERDLAEVPDGARLLRKIAATSPLAGVIEKELEPGAEKNGDAQLLQDFRERAVTVYHPVSTCCMGTDPATSVVDARLRVHGVPGLRVVDASIFPTVTSGNTNTPTTMVAEKASDLIKEEEGG
jgi:choline dehydrogenase-like flavoprotein